MSLIVVGLNHRSAPLDLIERTAIGPAELPKALHDLTARGHLAESVVLSTCNRTEVYARATKFHPGVQEICEFLAGWSNTDPEQIAEHVYTYHDDAAVMHLFSVAAGVDSMIVGESEVLGQVREAWAAARAEGSVRHVLDRAFRHSIEVGKRVRTETSIGRGTLSVPHAAVGLAAVRLGLLEGRTAVVLGAGVMGAGLVRALVAKGVTDVVVANRTTERADELIRRFGGRAIGLDDVGTALADADLLLTATGASGTVLTRHDIESAMDHRPDRPLLIVDIAVPRVDPGAAQVPGVTLLDMGDLEGWSTDAMTQRRAALPQVREILTEELERFRLETEARTAAPVVTALRSRADEIRTHELERAAGRLASLDDREREAVEALTRGIVNKLLHEPTVRLKASAGTADGESYAEVLAALFDLG